MAIQNLKITKKIKKELRIFLLITFIIFFPYLGFSVSDLELPKQSDTYLVTGNQLNEEGKKYDREKVVFSGEVIGDIFRKGDYCWVNVSDGNFTIGVWMKYEDAKKIKYLGRYGIKGDILKVEGTYYENCPIHYGENDIHAENVTIINEGKIVKEELNIKKIFLSLILGVIVLIFILIPKKFLLKENE